MLCDFMDNLACKYPFKINNPNIIQRMLMTTPFRMNWGLCIFKKVCLNSIQKTQEGQKL